MDAGLEIVLAKEYLGMDFDQFVDWSCTVFGGSAQKFGSNQENPNYSIHYKYKTVSIKS